MLVVCVGSLAGNVVAQLDKVLGELAKNGQRPLQYIYLVSPSGECFERNTASLGPVPICSRGSHGDQRLHSLMGGGS
jgi:hypothetical protein